MTAERSQEFSGALALNDLAVSLMERKSYEFAIKTLKDSIHAMRCVICGVDSEREQDGSLVLNKKIQKAYQRFSKTQPPPVTEHEGRPKYIEAITYDDLIPRICLRTEGLPDGLLCPVRLNNLDSPFGGLCHEDSSEEEDAELQTSLIMCNLGIAYYLLYKSKRNNVKNGSEKDENDKLLDVARKVLQAAMSVIANRFSVCENEFDETQLMTVALLVSANVSQVEHECGSDATVFFNNCKRLQKALHQCQVAKWLSMVEARNAAPAA